MWQQYSTLACICVRYMINVSLEGGDPRHYHVIIQTSSLSVSGAANAEIEYIAVYTWAAKYGTRDG